MPADFIWFQRTSSMSAPRNAITDRIRRQRLLSQVVFAGRNFRRVEIGSSKEPANALIGSAVYRFRRSQCAAVTRDSRARIALRNDVKRGAGYCEPGNELRTEVKSPRPNVAVLNPGESSERNVRTAQHRKVGASRDTRTAARRIAFRCRCTRSKQQAQVKAWTSKRSRTCR